MAKRVKIGTVDVGNLAKLGPMRLAEIMFELAADDATLKRRLKFEVLRLSGDGRAAREVEKRIASLKRARSFIDWNKVRAFARDLDTTRRQIAEGFSDQDADTAYTLMWSFLETASKSYARCDDSNGELGDVYRQAVQDLGHLAAQRRPVQTDLVDKIFRAVGENDYGQFDDVIDALAPVLEKDGLAELRNRLERAAAEAEADLKANGQPQMKTRYGVAYLDEDDMDGWIAKSRLHALRYALQAVADLQGDVDAYAAQFDSDARKAPAIASQIAIRLLEAGRAKEALAVLDGVEIRGPEWRDPGWEAAKLRALEALNRASDAQDLRWKWFSETFSRQHLKDYLGQLADFDDIEAETKALDLVEADDDQAQALVFLIEWPALDRASRLIIGHAGQWHGGDYMLLVPAADSLEAKFPLASVVLRRSLIDFALEQARSSRYKHAARHVVECQALDARIEDYGSFENHTTYMLQLKKTHGRKWGFWSLLND